MTFGEKVRELRLKNGYSQEELAAMTGVTRRTVRNWEAEGKYPRSQALYARLAWRQRNTARGAGSRRRLFSTAPAPCSPEATSLPRT